VDRRTCLRLLGAASALGLAGCLSEGSENADTEPPAALSTPANSGETTTGTPASRPALGGCDATDPPSPSTGDGLPDPREYPEQPTEMTAETVQPFLEAYESAHRFNRELAALAADGDCVEYLDASTYESTVTAVGSEITGSVETRASYTGGTCTTVTGTETPTPLPHADLAIESARYRVSDRFLLRKGVVVECWE